MHSKETSSAPRRGSRRGVPQIGAENIDSRPFRCVRRPGSARRLLGVSPHQWGVIVGVDRLPHTGKPVRVEYCKREHCHAVRYYELPAPAEAST